MKRTVTIVAAAALASCVLAPAAGAANQSPNPKQVANEFCHTQKQEMGPQNFKATYNGGKRAMQTCKRQNQPEAEEIVQNASQECRDAQESDPSGFQTTYGENKNGKNAFGKCVSQSAKAQSDEQAQNLANAAHQCKEERDADEAAFTQTYGTNKNGKNAFGKCVSQKAQAQQDDEPQPAPTS